MSKSTLVTLKLISKETCKNSSHFFPLYFSLLKDMHNAGQILIYGKIQFRNIIFNFTHHYE